MTETFRNANTEKSKTGRTLVALAFAALFGALPIATTITPAAADDYASASSRYDSEVALRHGVVGVITNIYHSNVTINTPSGLRLFELREGTIIYPTGTRLQNGMVVSIQGHHAGSGALLADNVSIVPPSLYSYVNGVPVYDNDNDEDDGNY
ncbi:hypothetical protein EPN42_07500 [bacterium]|nr:MAG: hypothetical protein EPN42_07500 [bacterium]